MTMETSTAFMLAKLLVATDWSPEYMEKAILETLARKTTPKWPRSLIAEILERSPTAYAPSPQNVARTILESRTFRRLRLNDRERPLFDHINIPAPIFAPTLAFRDSGIPEFASLNDLSKWLSLPVPYIRWFADVEGYRASAETETTRNYRYMWAPKKFGPPRLIEAPKPLLKGVQHKILGDILDRIPPHDCAHGFRKGRSCIGAAQLHAGEHIVITIDLKDYFPSIPIRSVHGLFRSLGYPWKVARCLTGLCSTATPADIFKRLPRENRHDRDTSRLFLQQHLPQGAPTSPALSNLCAWRLDCRLEGLAKRMDARYTRYGDDLAFSGDREFARHAAGFLRTVTAICNDSSLSVNRRKTRIMRQDDRQLVTGLVVNQHVNIPRGRYDRLKAILHNCVRHGATGQNRDGHPDFRAHLDGRITWLENVNLRKGHRLRLLFQQIEWA